MKSRGPASVGAVPTADEMGAYLTEMGHLASAAQMWFPAAEEYRRAGDADLRRKQESLQRMTEAETGRAVAWAARADLAGRTGRPADQRALLETIAFRARGTAPGERANIQLLALRAKESAPTRDDADRVATATDRARRRIERAKVLTARADVLATGDPSRDAWYARAAYAAFCAARITGIAAQRYAPTVAPWKLEPRVLIAEARVAEGAALAARAALAVSGGRFALAERLAQRALVRTPGDAKAKRALDEAQAGLLRWGVLVGSPPPGVR